MPELAEIEFFRRRWHEAGHQRRVVRVRTHAAKKTFREAPAARLARGLRDTVLTASAARAKQMLFRFGDTRWLGIHLGMTGELFVAPPDYRPRAHDHLALELADGPVLVFRDPRMFGGVRWHEGADEPAWWARIAPDLLSPAFTAAALSAFLQRRARSPLKAVLLMQERFPGVGNWMADEILWRAALHPARPAGSLSAAERGRLHREIRQVCRLALRQIAGVDGPLPPDLNVNIPDTWLFNHRWTDGGRCPRTGVPLVREEIGGRTTCWSPGRQASPGRAL
jgi:formamidopyrimidine-DNA glycosylase